MTSIAQQTHHVTDQIRVRLMHPQPPRPDLLPNRQVRPNLLVQLGIRRQQLLNRPVRAAPRVVREIALLPREETVVREQAATVAGRQHDLVPAVVLPAPVLQRAVLRVIDQPEADGVLGAYVGVQTARVGGFLLRLETDDATHGGADAICANDEVMLRGLAVGKGDQPRLEVDVLALLSLSILSLSVGQKPYLMVHEQLHRRPLPLLLHRAILQHGMHVLPMEHVVHVPPSLLIPS